MIYKQVSSKAIIAKVLKDYSLSLDNIRVTDIISWVGEGLNKINAYPYYNIKSTGYGDEPLLEISGYQVQLPSDLKEIISIKYSGTQNGYYRPIRYGTSNFGSIGEVNTREVTSTDVAPTTLLITTVMSLYNYTYAQAVTAINTDSALRERITALLNVQTSEYSARAEGDDSSMDYVYYIIGDYIKLNVETGYLKVAYLAKPIDEEGYPLVPDEESFIEALYWYVVMKLQYPEWAQGRLRDAVYYQSMHNWNYYCKQAYGRALMPSGDKYEALKNQWLKIYPEINAFDLSQATLGDKQIIYNR